MLRKMVKQCDQEKSSISLVEMEIVPLRVNTLQEGASFGELALISKKGLRTASIKADTLTHLGVIS